jgi:hypothetical protein
LSREWGTSADGHGLKSVWATFPSRPTQRESTTCLLADEFCLHTYE